MAKNFYQIEKVINGKKYVAQFNGLSAALEAVDSTYIDGTGVTSLKKFNKYLLENVIVEPKGLTADDFSDSDELGEVTAFARDVMQGKLKPEKAKAESKDK